MKKFKVLLPFFMIFHYFIQVLFIFKLFDFLTCKYLSLETLTCIFLNINSKVNIHLTQKRKVLQNIFFKSFVENSLHLIAVKILLTHILYSHTYTNIVSILSVDVRICVEYEFLNIPTF